MPAPIRVGIVMPLAEQRGGAELMLMHLLRESCGRSDVAYYLAFFEDGPLVEEARGLGYPAVIIRSGRLRELARLLGTIVALKNWIRQNHLRAVMAWMAKAHNYSGPAALWAGVPSIWWQHAIAGRSYLERIVSALPADAIFACSDQANTAQAGRTPHRKIQTIYPGVDLAGLRAHAAEGSPRKQLGIDNSRLLVCMITRLQRWKGIHNVMEALSLLRSESSLQAHLVIVGGEHSLEPGYKDELLALSSRLGLAGSVSFVGFQENVAPWISDSDIFINASMEEPFGMSIVEAMALGKAVIAVGRGGPAEIIAAGENGLLIDDNSPVSIAAALRQLAAHPQTRMLLGKQAFERAEFFSTANLARNVAMAVVAAILSKP